MRKKLILLILIIFGIFFVTGSIYSYNQVNKFKFAFMNVEKDYESYRGIEVNVRYILKVTIGSTLRSLSWEREFGVVKPDPPEVLTSLNDPIKLEVGIGDWLHLSFELDKSKFSTKGICTGKVTFKKPDNKSLTMRFTLSLSTLTLIVFMLSTTFVIIFENKMSSKNTQTLLSASLTAVKQDNDTFKEDSLNSTNVGEKGVIVVYNNDFNVISKTKDFRKGALPNEEYKEVYRNIRASGK